MNLQKSANPFAHPALQSGKSVKIKYNIIRSIT